MTDRRLTDPKTSRRNGKRASVGSADEYPQPSVRNFHHMNSIHVPCIIWLLTDRLDINILHT